MIKLLKKIVIFIGGIVTALLGVLMFTKKSQNENKIVEKETPDPIIEIKHTPKNRRSTDKTFDDDAWNRLTRSNRTFQHDPRLPQKVNKYGCCWRSHLAICETYTGKIMSARYLNELYDENLAAGYITREDVSVKKPMLVINSGFKKLGYKYTALQVGIRDTTGNITFWGNKERRIDATVIRYVVADGTHDHYLEGDPFGAILWDPYDGKDKLGNHIADWLYKIEV
jgi:hypothetical protein